MNQRQLLLTTCGSILTLSACAPLVTHAGRPVQAPSPTATTIVPAGESTFIEHKYPASYFGITDEVMKEAVPINWDNRDSFSRVNSGSRDVPWLQLSDARTPAGWNVKLVRVTAEREIVNTTNKDRVTEVSYYNNLRLTYAVTVPANAQGEPLLTLTIRNQSGKSHTLPLRVRVAQ